MTDGTGRSGGAGRSRTGDPLLAKQVLYQLSYGPMLGYKMMYIKNDALRNLLCAINRDPEDSGFNPTASFDHRRDSR